MTQDFEGLGRYASPPCLASEIAPDYFDPLAVDPEQARDVARWRKAERQRLLGERRALSVSERERISAALASHLEPLILARIEALWALHPQSGAPVVVSGYWPIKGEPDLRPLLRRLHSSGLRLALPLVETKAAPLVFRQWTPDTAMVSGDWNIPVPPPDAPMVQPQIALAPLVGWDAQGYRLGYGGGYFDRTLAAAQPRPLTIGVGFEAARLPSIFPQPHDVGLDAIVTEDGTRVLSVR